MEKNCTACKGRHVAPFGSKCKFKITMAVVAGYDRDSEEYVKMLEDEFCRNKKEKERLAREHDSKEGITTIASDFKLALDALSDRLRKLETSPTSSDKGDISAASLFTTPLTKALARLSGDDDDEGKYYRPEYYAQHEIREKGRDHNKLDSVGLFYGWTCVANYIMKHGGNLGSYLDHIKYASGMLNTRQFFDAGAIKYDRMIVDRFLEGKSSSFAPDPVLSSLTFSSRIIPDSSELCHGASLTKGVTSYPTNRPNRGKKRPGQSRRYEDVPADFPADICFYFNYRRCYDENCPKSHTCRRCGGKHRADACQDKSRKS